MFPTYCVVERILRLRMFSYLFTQKNINDPLTVILFYHLQKKSSPRCFCVKSADSDPRGVVTKRYEMQECSDNNSLLYEDSEIKNTTYKERCISKIEKTFMCSYSEASALYIQYPHLFHERIGDSMKKIAMFKDAGISEKSLFKNVEILELDNDEIVFRLDQMNAWGLNDEQKSDMLALLKLETDLFQKIAHLYTIERDKIPLKNRFIYFSKVLNCTLEKTVDLSMKYRHLLTRRFEDMKQKFETLFDHGISPESLRNSLWLTAYRIESIKEWLNFSNVKLASCSKFDKFMINFFQKLKEKYETEKTALKPNETIDEFLAEKLQIDSKIIKYLMSRHPKTFSDDLSHITKVIDFLYSHGYTGVQICSNHSVLRKDISFLQNRLEESEKLGCGKLPLSILCAQKSNYQKYMCGLIKRD